MDRFDHRVVGVATGLAVGAAAHWPVGQALAGAACAWATAGGRLSPDMDQQWRPDRGRVPLGWRVVRACWRAYARLVTSVGPWRRERSRWGDPCQHRGITHWPGVPVMWAVLVAPASLAWPGPWWLAWGLLAGWASHLIPGDWLFGRQVWGQHGHGIPWAPWWGHHGLPLRVGLRSDGWAAHVFALGGAVPASLWLVAVIAHL